MTCINGIRERNPRLRQRIAAERWLDAGAEAEDREGVPLPRSGREGEASTDNRLTANGKRRGDTGDRGGSQEKVKKSQLDVQPLISHDAVCIVKSWSAYRAGVSGWTMAENGTALLLHICCKWQGLLQGLCSGQNLQTFKLEPTLAPPSPPLPQLPYLTLRNVCTTPRSPRVAAPASLPYASLLCASLADVRSTVPRYHGIR